MAQTIPATVRTVAEVTDSTPDYLEYGSYRGWVGLDADGAWVLNLADEDVAATTVTWEVGNEGYGRVGTVTHS
jgi:hypothetical protein